jgi:hypothetical protein
MTASHVGGRLENHKAHEDHKAILSLFVILVFCLEYRADHVSLSKRSHRSSLGNGERVAANGRPRHPNAAAALDLPTVVKPLPWQEQLRVGHRSDQTAAHA